MQYKPKYAACLTGFFLFLFLLVTEAAAQRIPFGLYSSYNITLSKPLEQDLNFGPVISGSGTKSIILTDNEVVVIEIEAVSYLDITVTLTSPVGDRLVLEGNEENLNVAGKYMNTDIYMAYYNRGPDNIPLSTAQAQAVPISGDMFTFQVRRRLDGPPGPPPTPPHAGYVPPTAKAYLFVYGNLHVGQVNAGPYSGIIDIHVEYATYQ
jgi:hypothetical protein